MFYGHQLHMTREETMNTRFGEMLDLVSCLAIYNGGAEEKTKKTWTFSEAMALK